MKENYLSLITSYWDFCTSSCTYIVVAITTIFDEIKKLTIEFQTNVLTNEQLNKEVSFLHDVNTTLKESKIELEEKIIDIYKNTVNIDLFKNETDRLNNLNEKQQKIITELNSDLRVSEIVSNKLTVQNNELYETLKLAKSTTTIDKSLKILTILENSTFVLIQVINAYNSLFHVTDSVNVPRY